MNVVRITRFTGPYAFLSNMEPCTVILDGKEYGSVEHAYQAAKTLSEAIREEIRKLPPTRDGAKAAKRIGNTLTPKGRLPERPEWHSIKFGIMRALLEQKFAPGTLLAEKLLATGDAELIEGNWWGDTVWGVCYGKGENHLGRMLMGIRDSLRRGPKDSPFAP